MPDELGHPLRWQRLGLLFDPRIHPQAGWMKEYAQSPSALVLEDRVRVFFCSRPAPDAQGMYRSHIASLDLDREHPDRVIDVCTQPLLPLGERGCFDEFGTNPVSVIRTGEGIRAYFAGWTRCESVPINAAIGLALSSDEGRSFARLGPGPVLGYSPDEPFMLGSPRIKRFGDSWYLWYACGRRWLAQPDGRPEPVYKIRMARSADGVHWTPHGRDLLPDVLGADECQACADVTHRGDRYHMFFSYRRSHDYRGTAGGYRIGYAWSQDLITWHRNDARAGFTPAASGWDSEMVSYGHLFELDGATYMLYQGNEMGRGGIGIARLDGDLAE